VTQPDERHATEQLLCWSDTDTEHTVQHLVQTTKKKIISLAVLLFLLETAICFVYFACVSPNSVCFA